MQNDENILIKLTILSIMRNNPKTFGTRVVCMYMVDIP